MVFLDNGERDTRYSVTREDNGRHLARFNGSAIAAASSEPGAWKLARRHAICRVGGVTLGTVRPMPETVRQAAYDRVWC